MQDSAAWGYGVRGGRESTAGSFLLWPAVIGWEETTATEGPGYSLSAFLFLNGGCSFFSPSRFKLSSAHIYFHNRKWIFLKVRYTETVL